MTLSDSTTTQFAFATPDCYFSGERALVLTLSDYVATHNTLNSDQRFLIQQAFWALRELLETSANWQPVLDDVVIGMFNITLYLKHDFWINDLTEITQITGIKADHSIDSVAAFTARTQSIQAQLIALWEGINITDWQPKKIEIPTYYGGEFGEDLLEVAAHNNLTPSQVIELHSSTDYPIYFMGFQPGFPYLGGLSSQLFTPRRAVPRVKVRAGSVGIGGEQTGIYPFDSPGGWQIIGYTPFKLFDLNREPIIGLRTGDVIRFVPQG